MNSFAFSVFPPFFHFFVFFSPMLHIFPLWQGPQSSFPDHPERFVFTRRKNDNDLFHALSFFFVFLDFASIY